MPNEILKMTSEIVVAHASLTELTPEQLVQEIKEVHQVLAELESQETLAEPLSEKPEAPAGVKEPPIPLKDIVKAKYVVCLECGRKLRTLKTHLREAHGLAPKDYYARFNLDPHKFPLVCKDYSAARSQMAKARGFGKK